MTVVPSIGRTWLNKRRYGHVTGTIDTLVLGTGTTTESDGNTFADVEGVYRTNETSEVYFEPREDADGNETITECGIDINVGQQVPLGTTLTELAVIASDGDVLIARDTFGGITLEEGASGRSFERYLQLPVED